MEGSPVSNPWQINRGSLSISKSSTYGLWIMAYRHMGIWAYGHMGIWAYGHMGISA